MKIVDAPCGAGKSSFAFQEINTHPEQRYIYCTPYLDEIKRVKQRTGSRRFSSPEPFYYDAKKEGYTGSSKLKSFNQLLREKKDVAVTHSTFLNADEETTRLIEEGNYILLLDEAPDVVQLYNATSTVERDPTLHVTKEDLPHLLSGDYLKEDPQSTKLLWGSKHWARFSELERQCRQGKIYCARKNELLCVFPPEVFEAFSEVYLFLYVFKGTFFHSYLEKFDIAYSLHSIEQDDTGSYRLTDFNQEKDLQYRRQMKDLIRIVGAGNRYPGKTLSKSWFRRASDEQLAMLRGSLGNFFRKIAAAKARDAMWSCFVDYKACIKHDGYVYSRRLTREEKLLPKEQQIQIRQDTECFVASNARATNKYADRWALAYCLNFYPNLDIESFFTDGKDSVEFSRDLFAVQILVQWVFRSRIRKGEPIVLYLPSARMERLFRAWLDGEIG